MNTVTEDPNWLQELMSRTDFITLELMRAAGVSTSNRAVKPYWKKLAVWMQDFCVAFNTDDPTDISRDLCRYHNVNPDQESLGCGSIVLLDQKYRLMEAWMPLANAYIKACDHYDKKA